MLRRIRTTVDGRLAHFFVTLAVANAVPQSATAQQDTHAATGEFKPPTPANEHRQDSRLDNLVHPEGYLTAPLGSLGQVVVRGEGDVPVVLVAGLGFGWRVFESVMEAHAADYRFYAVSLPGYGGSSAPPMPPAGTSFGERTWLAGAQRGLAALIENEGLDRPIVAALYSDAANVVTRLAAEAPREIGGVLIMSASARFPLPPSAPSRSEALDRFASQWFRTVTEIMWPSGMFTPDFYATDLAIAERAWWEVLEPSLPTSIRYMVETWADDLVPVLSNLSVPTTVLSPGFDEEFMTGMGGDLVRQRFHAGWDEAAEAGGAIEHRVLDGARFLIWHDRPDAVGNALANLAARR